MAENETIWATQVIDTFIDHFEHKPVVHNSEQTARNYAADITRRRQCIARLLRAGRIVDIYEDGVSSGAAAA